MKRVIKMKATVRFILQTGSILILAGCHAPNPEPTTALELPLLERTTLAADVLADGSILIDSDLLVKHIGTDGVFILSTDNRARFRMIKAGKKVGKRITISSGLTGSEQILTGPYTSVFDGSPVSVGANKMRTKQ